jgi:hypothetical protein
MMKKHGGVKLLTFEFLAFPFESEGHWMCVFVDIKNKLITILNSKAYNYPSSEVYCQRVLEVLKVYQTDVGAPNDFNIEEWTISPHNEMLVREDPRGVSRTILLNDKKILPM